MSKARRTKDMKKILVGLLVFGSFSSFAESATLTISMKDNSNKNISVSCLREACEELQLTIVEKGRLITTWDPVIDKMVDQNRKVHTLKYKIGTEDLLDSISERHSQMRGLDNITYLKDTKNFVNGVGQQFLGPFVLPLVLPMAFLIDSLATGAGIIENIINKKQFKNDLKKVEKFTLGEDVEIEYKTGRFFTLYRIFKEDLGETYERTTDVKIIKH
jgi:hypothetical protein